jgi:hypothetical protein
MTASTPDVHTLEERAGEARATLAIEQRREAAALDLVARKQFDVANLSDRDFELGLERIRIRQQRMQRILKTALVEGVHYGNPKTRDGRPVFPKPILFQAGAEELRNLFRLQLVRVGPPEVVETPDYVSVTVTMAVQDGAGRVLAPRTGNCNTMEKRFERRDGKGWIYTDAREMVHQCYAMAEKRAGVFATREVTGATGFFAAEEEMEKALEAREAEAAGRQPMRPEDRESFERAAVRAGVPKEQLADFIDSAIGERRDLLRSDIPTLREALRRFKAQRAEPGKKAEAKKPEAPPAQPGDAFDDDLALDRELAKEE